MKRVKGFFEGVWILSVVCAMLYIPFLCGFGAHWLFSAVVGADWAAFFAMPAMIFGIALSLLLGNTTLD